MEMTNKEYDIKVEELKERLTPEFLETLIECIKVMEYNIDSTEVTDFVTEIFNIAEKEMPEDIDGYIYELEEDD